MTDSCIRLILDLRETDTPAAVQAKLGDTGRVLQIALTDGGVPYPISEDCSAVFTGKKADGTVVYNPCRVEDNEILYPFTEQTCACAGNMDAEVRLYGSGGKLLTSASFLLEIQDTVFREGDVVSRDEMNALDALVLETRALKEEVEQKLENGEFTGPQGPAGRDGTVKFEELTEQQRESLRGTDGTVAFEELTEQQRASLKGEPGEPGKPGEPGQSAYACAVEAGYTGSPQDFAEKLAAPWAGAEALDTHLQNKNNPHGVTATQVGARPDTWLPTPEQIGAVTAAELNTAVRKAAPQNLLINSNFRNPVNTNGKTGYTGTQYAFTVDRWYTSHAALSVNISSSGVNIDNRNNSANGYMNQKLHRIKDGTYTIVLRTNEGISYRVFTLSGTTVTTKRFENKENSIVTVSYSDKLIILIGSKAGTVVTAYNVALYEEEYTADTIPDYQPKDYETELMLCRQYEPNKEEYIGLRKFSYAHNLLDNSDFTNPVNQRGFTSKTIGATQAYFFDRWYSARTKLSATSDGLSFAWDGTNGSDGWIQQKIPLKHLFGKTMTVSIVLSDGSVNVASGVVPTTVNASNYYSANGISIAFSNHGGNAFSVVVFTKTTTPVIIKNIAVYEGAYSADTLPDYHPKGYTVELAECRRYFKRLGGVSTGYVGYGSIYDSAAKKLFITLPMAGGMISTAGIKVATSGIVRCFSEVGTSYEVADVTYSSQDSMNLIVVVTMAAALDGGKTYLLRTDNTAYIDITAE